MFNQMIAKTKPSLILQCGDFGYWPRFHGQKYLDNMGKLQTWDSFNLKNHETQIYFCDGNHEDFQELYKLTDNEIMKNVFYMKRGSTYRLRDGRNVLFIGGALSIDKKYRTQGIDWFPEETITQKEIYDLPDLDIDIVISHTAPEEFNVLDYHLEFIKDPSRAALSFVLNKYKPKLWYFGHMHLFKQGKHNNCKWTCLSGIGLEGRWWIPLEE